MVIIVPNELYNSLLVFCGGLIGGHLFRLLYTSNNIFSKIFDLEGKPFCIVVPMLLPKYE